MNPTQPMTGKTCLVTGANAGIGKATALGLAEMGATVVMVCRDRNRGEAALAWVREKSRNVQVSLVVSDLSSQTAIRDLASKIESQFPALHVLINNAGVIPRERAVTVDKIETQFAVNHLAYFLLTNLLLDLLIASAPARIINVSSRAHRRAAIDFDDLGSERAYHPVQVYSRTKLANLLFTYELSRRLRGTQVTANCLHPGLIGTRLLGDFLPRGLQFAARLLGSSPEKGARTSLFLASSPQVEGVSGEYFVNRRAVSSSGESYDEEAATRLWRISSNLTGMADTADGSP